MVFNITVTECPDLSNMTSDYIRADVSGRTVGSQATFSCPTGYGLRGDDTLECLDTGQWSADVPSCEGKYLYKNFVISKIKFLD